MKKLKSRHFDNPRSVPELGVVDYLCCISCPWLKWIMESVYVCKFRRCYVDCHDRCHFGYKVPPQKPKQLTFKF